MIKSETINKISIALVKAQAEMGTAHKSAKNPFFKSFYADLNSIREAALPALNKHNIAVLQPTVVFEGKKYVQTTLLHESGEFIACLTEVLCLKENDAQQQGSGITYARRYGLQSMLNIGAEDDDGNAASGKVVNGQQEQSTPVAQKTVKTMTFKMPSDEQLKEIEFIKKSLVAQPRWKEDWRAVMKEITGATSLEELAGFDIEILKEISKRILFKYTKEK